MREEFCDWHVIVVDGHEDDPETFVMHPPSCAFIVEVGFKQGTGFNYACQIQNEIDNAGFSTLLGDFDLSPGDWYRARMRHYTIRGLDWSEVDCDYEVVPIGPAFVPQEEQ